jgi:polyisoprenyl-phosphate glycosyltransferase
MPPGAPGTQTAGEARDAVTAADAGRLFVVCPVFLDGESFLRLRGELLARLGEALPARPVRFLVVDDSAGTDPELSRLRGLADVSLLTPPFSLGHQRALVFGLRSLGPRLDDDDVIVTMDADGEDRPEDVSRLVAELLAEPPAPGRIVMARRTSRQVSPLFHVMYFFFVILFRLLTGTLIRTGNFAAYRGFVVRNVLFHPHFDLSYSASLVSLDLDVRFVPCPRARRYAGRSRMSPLKLIRHGISMLMPFLDRIAVRALVAFSGVFGLGAASAVLAGALLALGMPIPAWTGRALGVVLLLSFLALGNFVILFAIYAQSQGAALSGLERARRPPPDLGEG